MRMQTTWIGTLAVAALAISTAGAATTEKQKALSEGAEQLTSDEIVERFVGRTATFVSASGDKEVLVYYGEDNNIAGKLVGGDWTGTGYYGVANDDSICLSWDERDEGRLRCLDVLATDGVIQKYRPDGSLSGNIVAFDDGKTFCAASFNGSGGKGARPARRGGRVGPRSGPDGGARRGDRRRRPRRPR